MNNFHSTYVWNFVFLNDTPGRDESFFLNSSVQKDRGALGIQTKVELFLRKLRRSHDVEAIYPLSEVRIQSGGQGYVRQRAESQYVDVACAE